MEKRELAQFFEPIQGTAHDFDGVMEYIADAPFVLMGEATHGTEEFYRARIAISKRLILEKGFRVISIEADFPDVYRINRFINFQGHDATSKESLADFERFPTWMWRNEEMVSFIDWLREHNRLLPSAERVSIFGLDLYSLYKSISIVINQLHKIDPELAAQAKKRYQCLDSYRDPQQYGYMASVFADKSCQEEAVEQYLEIVKMSLHFFEEDHDHASPLEEKFYIEQNALLIKNAEEYYRSLFSSERSLSWNLRDRHMMQVIESLESFAQNLQKKHKIIVWAHNSHIGDARATQMASYGELNVGQLIKEAYGAKAVSIGFTTYSGTVSAASAWDGDVEKKMVRPALAGSVETVFHNLGLGDCILMPHKHPELEAFFSSKKYLERAIGVIYLPQTERQSHYFYADILRQFDMIIHYDVTHAVVPLEPSMLWHKGEEGVPELFPFGV